MEIECLRGEPSINSRSAHRCSPCPQLYNIKVTGPMIDFESIFHGQAECEKLPASDRPPPPGIRAP